MIAAQARRRFLGTVGGLSIFAVGHSAGARDQRAADTAVPALAPHALTPRVYFIEGEVGAISHRNRGFNSNAAFVVTRDGVLVFDVLGTPALGQAMRRAIRAVTPLPIRHSSGRHSFRVGPGGPGPHPRGLDDADGRRGRALCR